MSHLSFWLCDTLSLEVWPQTPRDIVLPVADPAIFGHKGPGVRRWGIFCSTDVPTVPFHAGSHQPSFSPSHRFACSSSDHRATPWLNLKEEKKNPHVILCVAHISAVTLPSQRKGKEMITGRVHASTNLGLNHQDWCSIAVISLPRLCYRCEATTSWSPHTSPEPCNPPSLSWGCCKPC